VADADCNYASVAGAVDILLSGQCRSPVYLYPILRALKGAVMKRFLVISTVVVVLVVFANWNNSKPANIISRVVERSKVSHGELKFRIDLFGVFPVGEAVIMARDKELYQAKEAYHLSAFAKTPDWLSSFFSSRAAVDSYLDVRTLEPLMFREKVIIKNKPDKVKEVIYDQKNQVMSIEGERRHILAGTHDPLSAIAYIRRMDFDRVKDFQLNINTNQKNYILKGTAESYILSVSGKKYRIAVLKADISRKENNPYHKSKVSMVVLKDRENLPLLIKVFAGGVFISAKLTEMR